MREDPLKKLSKIDSTPEIERRAMSADEFKRMMAVAPYHRQILYMLAVLTGLRANELRSLTREHLDIEQQGVWLDDDWTKNRRPGFQPLPKATINLLVENFDSGIVQRMYSLYARGNTYHPRALVYVPVKTDRDIALDLEQAKIPKETQK